jgi:hypothetical protein
MDIPALEGLADELVRLCDRVDKYGLVDFQMGVAEDEIIDRECGLLCKETLPLFSARIIGLHVFHLVILRCLAALEPRQDEPSNSIETD